MITGHRSKSTIPILRNRCPASAKCEIGPSRPSGVVLMGLAICSRPFNLLPWLADSRRSAAPNIMWLAFGRSAQNPKARWRSHGLSRLQLNFERPLILRAPNMVCTGFGFFWGGLTRTVELYRPRNAMHPRISQSLVIYYALQYGAPESGGRRTTRAVLVVRRFSDIGRQPGVPVY